MLNRTSLHALTYLFSALVMDFAMAGGSTPASNALPTGGRQIPYSWLAYYDGGHAFLFQQHGRFSETVNAFLK